MLMLITAMLKHHFPSEAVPECDWNHREERPRESLKPSLPSLNY